MHLAVGQRWLNISNIGNKYYRSQVVEILQVLEDKIKNPDYPNCRSCKVKILQLNEGSSRGVFFLGKIYETNFIPMYVYENKFWRFLPGQEAPQEKD